MLAFLANNLGDVITLALGLPVVTIVRSYRTTSRVGHLEEWMTFPHISILGFREPERRFYALGFAATGILYALLGIVMHAHIFASMKNKPRKITIYNRIALVLSLIAGAGVATQGVLPLQSDFLDVMTGKTKTNTQSMIHQLSAVVFFITALFHAYLTKQVIDSIPLRKLKSALFSLLRNLILLLLASAIVLSTVLHPTAKALEDMDRYHRLLNFGGICQYTVILCIVGFFATYLRDAKNLVNSRGNLDHIDYDKTAK